MLYLVCIFRDIGSICFVIGDFAPDPIFRNVATISAILVLRSISILHACSEAARVVDFTAYGFWAIIRYITDVLCTISSIAWTFSDILGFVYNYKFPGNCIWNSLFIGHNIIKFYLCLVKYDGVKPRGCGHWDTAIYTFYWLQLLLWLQCSWPPWYQQQGNL